MGSFTYTAHIPKPDPEHVGSHCCVVFLEYDGVLVGIGILSIQMSFQSLVTASVNQILAFSMKHEHECSNYIVNRL